MVVGRYGSHVPLGSNHVVRGLVRRVRYLVHAKLSAWLYSFLTQALLCITRT